MKNLWTRSWSVILWTLSAFWHARPARRLRWTGEPWPDERAPKSPIRDSKTLTIELGQIEHAGPAGGVN